MGGEVLPSYLRSKLSSILDEADSDSDSDCPSQIISRIRSFIESYQIMSKSPMMISVDHLHELIKLVSECRVFSFERRTAALSKKGFGFGFYFLKLLLHPSLSKSMFNRRMRRRLDTIQKKMQLRTASQEPPPPPPAAPVFEETYPIGDPSLISGFEAEAEKIEAWLMPSQEEEDAAALKLRAVGIVGRCGCGKTALAQKVFNSAIVKKEFSPRIWVCLSNMLQFDDRKVRVVNYILREMDDDGGGDDHCSLDNLMERLRRGLMGKRYLIVLDNAWRLQDEWYEELLSHGLPSGGAVIVTSRREDVIRRMVVGDGDKHVIRLQPHLSDEVCWQIFSNELQQQAKMDLTHPKLPSIQDDVKRNFDGLPLAAKTLAIILPDLLFKTCWVRARDLKIWNGDSDSYWRWTSLPPPQEAEKVAEMVGSSHYLDIEASVELKELFINTPYSAHLVFKLMKTNPSGKNPEAMKQVRIVREGKSRPECETKRSVNLRTEGMQRKGEDEQGWMEINLGGIITSNLGHHGRFFEAKIFSNRASTLLEYGLVVKGIEFRPDYNYNY